MGSPFRGGCPQRLGGYPANRILFVKPSSTPLVGRGAAISADVGRVTDNRRHHMNLIGNFLTSPDFADWVPTLLLSRSRAWSAAIEAARPRSVSAEATTRACFTSSSSARTLLSLTPSRR